MLTRPTEALGSKLAIGSPVDKIERIIHEIDTSPLNRGLRGIDWVRDSRNVALFLGDDLALFDYEYPGVYEGHFFFQSRGKEAVLTAKIMTRKMFEEYGAHMLVGYTPLHLRKACVIASAAGWHYGGIKLTPYGACYVHMAAPETH